MATWRALRLGSLCQHRPRIVQTRGCNLSLLPRVLPNPSKSAFLHATMFTSDLGHLPSQHRPLRDKRNACFAFVRNGSPSLSPFKGIAPRPGRCSSALCSMYTAVESLHTTAAFGLTSCLCSTEWSNQDALHPFASKLVGAQQMER